MKKIDNSSMYKLFRYNILMPILLFFLIYFLLGKLFSSPLVNADWLSRNLCKSGVKVVEVGVSYNSYLVEHIQCANFTNFYKDGWRKNVNGINRALPLASDLVNNIEKMGIYNSDHVILYPKKASEYSMAEVTAIYFSFKYLGHKNISILNGGYPEFKKKYGLLIDEGIFVSKNKSNYNFKVNNEILATVKDVINYKKNKFILIDSRENDFYLGINKLIGFDSFGTIEGAINIPSKWFLRGRGLKFNDIDLIKLIYEEKKIKKEENQIFFCYTGLESSLGWFVAHEINKNKTVQLFEGSIFEWKKKNEYLHQKLLKKHRQ